jgi:peptidoglycan hydrolase CwlO-like protein
LKKVRLFSLPALAVLLSIGVITSCGQGNQTTPENLGKVSEFANENVQMQKEKNIKQIEAQLSQYNKSIEDLKSQAPGLEGQARDELNKKIEMLEKQTGELNKQVQDLNKTIEIVKDLPNTALEEILKYFGLDQIYKNIQSILKTFNQG